MPENNTPQVGNVATLVSPNILSNLKNSINPKAFGDQLQDIAKQKVISAIGQSALTTLYKEKALLIQEGINLDIQHSINLQKIELDHTPTKIISEGNIKENPPKLNDAEYQEFIDVENTNYELAKKNLQERKNQNQLDIDNLIKDPFKKLKDETKKRKDARAKAKTNNKRAKSKSKADRRKEVLGNVKKTLIPILTLLLSDKIAEVIAQNDSIKKLVDDTNLIIEAANLSNDPIQLNNARIVRDNALRIIQSNEDKIRKIADQIKVISVYINIFNVIVQILLAIPIPTSVPPGVGIPVNLILRLGQIIDKANRIILALSAYLPVVIGTLEKAISILQSYKEMLLEINGIIDETAANTLDLNSLLGINNDLGTYKGFKFALREENNPAFVVRGNKRRYAVAINKDNIEILKSEFSFTLDPNDLVEQLKLIIDQQNLQS